MKKVLAAILALVMAFALIGCGSKPGNENTPAEPPGSGTTDANQSDPAGKIGLEKEGEYIVFKVSPEFELTENCWLGIVPDGPYYTKEVDADEVDIYWTNVSNFSKKPAEDYVFQIAAEDIQGIEDGKYMMVLCDNDDEGSVILQFPITIKGAEISVDFSKLRIN